jgi:hypothetical protein
MLRFSNSIKVMAQMVISVTGPQSDESKGLEKLITMLQWLDEQEALLAATNPHSRPHSLVEFIREAKELERCALLVEKNTEQFKHFIALGKERAEQVMKHETPYVFLSELTLPPDARRARAEDYGRVNIEGPWCLVESV